MHASRTRRLEDTACSRSLGLTVALSKYSHELQPMRYSSFFGGKFARSVVATRPPILPPRSTSPESLSHPHRNSSWYNIILTWNYIKSSKQRQWFSGKIHRCHRWAPRSIRGWRNLLPFAQSFLLDFGDFLHLSAIYVSVRPQLCNGDEALTGMRATLTGCQFHTNSAC